MTPDTRPLLTIEDVMKRLRVSRSMAYKLTESGALRSIQIGRCVRVRPADLDRFINVNEP
jgi:excisionase family DNA binding protein